MEYVVLTATKKELQKYSKYYVPTKKRLNTLHIVTLLQRIPMPSILFYCTCPGLLNFYETHERWNYPQIIGLQLLRKTANVVKNIYVGYTHETSTLRGCNRANLDLPSHVGKNSRFVPR